MLKAADHAKAAGHLHALKGILSVQQMTVLVEMFKGDEAEFFAETVRDLDTTFKTMPKTYEQDGKGNEAVAHMHFFSSGNDYYITEKDMYDEQHQAFGLVKAGGDYELGYISLVELADNGVEIDLHWTPKTVGEIKAGI